MQPTTSVKYHILREELTGHPDSEFVEYVCDGLKFGFDTMVSETVLPTKECKNLLSARTQPTIVSQLLKEECEKGYILGPFAISPFESYRVSPIGVATGKYSNKKRLIIDLSAPHNDVNNFSVNDLIDKEQCSLTYVKLDDAIKKICETGKGSLLCKFDIKDAFKQCPIRKEQWNLFCIRWAGSIYVLVRLAFGCRSSPVIFDTLARSVCWIAENHHGVECILHLLDDFLTIDRPESDANITYQSMIYIFECLGIPLSFNKTVGPCTCLEYLGVILDSQNMEARLPSDKILRIKNFIIKLLNKRSCTKRELLQLLGHMNFATRVILAGRTFISYLLKLAASVKQLHYYVHLSKLCREDLHMWVLFLENWNGVSLFYEKEFTTSHDLKLHTDAASTRGFSVVYGSHWIFSAWPSEMPGVPDDIWKNSMTFMELYPIVAAAFVFSHEWRKKKILFICDNMAVVYILRKGRSKCPFVMKLMRKLTWLALINGFYFSAEYISTMDNTSADFLSRFQVEKYKDLNPYSDQNPTPCPAPENLLWN